MNSPPAILRVRADQRRAPGVLGRSCSSAAQRGTLNLTLHDTDLDDTLFVRDLRRLQRPRSDAAALDLRGRAARTPSARRRCDARRSARPSDVGADPRRSCKSSCSIASRLDTGDAAVSGDAARAACRRPRRTSSSCQEPPDMKRSLARSSCSPRAASRCRKGRGPECTVDSDCDTAPARSARRASATAIRRPACSPPSCRPPSDARGSGPDRDSRAELPRDGWLGDLPARGAGDVHRPRRGVSARRPDLLDDVAARRSRSRAVAVPGRPGFAVRRSRRRRARGASFKISLPRTHDGDAAVHGHDRSRWRRRTSPPMARLDARAARRRRSA